MMRTSNYTIYVDLPDDPEEMLLVHGYTGAYDQVSKRVATFLRSREDRVAPRPLYGTWTPEEEVEGGVTPPSEEALEILRRRGYLTHLTREQEQDLFVRIVGKLHALALRRPPSYVLMPTYNCNLRCPYCFQDHMRDEKADPQLLKVMDRRVVDRIFAAMPSLEKVHGFEKGEEVPRQITFFGGEPLLARSRPVVEYIVEKARSLGPAGFNAVTNGTELDAYRDLLGPQGISSLQITFDGPPEEHDQRRVYVDGSGSFEIIADNLTLALEQGVQVQVRMNIDWNNVHQLPLLADQIVERGWHDHDLFTAYIAPIRPENEKTDKATTLSMWDLNCELAELRAQHDNMRVIASSDEGTERRAKRIFGREGMVLPTMQASFCGAHNSMYVIDAFGDLYACWEETGDPAIRLGHIDGDGQAALETAVAEMWRSRTVASNPVCRQCRYALFCGGGCAVLAKNRSGTYFRNYCDGFRSRFRACVADAFTDFTAGQLADGSLTPETCGV